MGKCVHHQWYNDECEYAKDVLFRLESKCRVPIPNTSSTTAAWFRADVCITVRQFIFLLECWQTVSAGISRVRIIAPIVGSEVLVKTRPKGPFSYKDKKNLDVSSCVWPDVGKVFRTLIKKLISKLTRKPRDESFEAFDRVISTCGLL